MAELSMGDHASRSSIQGETIPPRPVFITDEWLSRRGVEDTAALWSAMRPESLVMHPHRLRSIKPTRLSFIRQLVRRMVDRRWRIERRFADISSDGTGSMLYRIKAEEHTFDFVVVSCANSGVERVGRAQDNEFDFRGSLFEGHISLERAQEEMKELRRDVWGGRTDNASLGWTLANRSTRYFNYTIERLASGHQPDVTHLISGGGYICRNAGWYGNGRHGCRSWLSYDAAHPLGGPYQLDVFALYLWRIVSFDIVDLTAHAINSQAATLADPIKRQLGVGNSSGVGMVATLVRWPAWLSAFNIARELALAYTLSRPGMDQWQENRLIELLGRAAAYYAKQPASSIKEIERPERLSKALLAVQRFIETSGVMRQPFPAACVSSWAARTQSIETAEQVNSILVEVEEDFADAAAELIPMGMATARVVEPRMSLQHLESLLETRYAWALALDLTAPDTRVYFWYRSEDNAESRRGEREIDPGVERETFVDVAGAVQALHEVILQHNPATSVGQFLLEMPEFSHVVSRVQLAEKIPYSEIRGNIIHRDFLPMNGIRFLLSTFGLDASDSYSTRWIRGVFLQGAPLVDDILYGHGGDWIFPSMGLEPER